MAAEYLRGSGYTAVLTDHFQQRRRERVKPPFCIPFGKLYKAAKRFAYRDCRTLLGGYWVVFKWEPHHSQLVFLTVMPRDFILPESSCWVLV